MITSNVSALVIESFANQNSNPTYIALFYQVVVVYDAIVDSALFDTVPTKVETSGIIFITAVAVIWLIYSMTQEKEEKKKESDKVK